jgi:hypothetical protein
VTRSLKLAMPKRPRGRLSREAQEDYDARLSVWCDGILEIKSRLDFDVSSRGWCYVLEEYGLFKSDFDIAQALINACRKSGHLPLDICSEDIRRAAEHLEDIDDETPEEEAARIVDYVLSAEEHYLPFSFWEAQDTYCEMGVEKIDLKSLFSVVCGPFRVALTNMSGWNDLNTRAAMMRRFACWERRGKRIVLLYCGDHDPGGFHIASFVRSNMADMTNAVGWSPDNLIIDRFGLNADFIRRNRLTWIDNLHTSSGVFPLDDPRHYDHRKSYVQDYLKKFGARKVEATALVRRPAAARALCRQAILKYLPANAPAKFQMLLELPREEMRAEIEHLLSFQFRSRGGR